MKTEKTILVKFCGSAVLFLAGAYFLPMWTAWGYATIRRGTASADRGS